MKIVEIMSWSKAEQYQQLTVGPYVHMFLSFAAVASVFNLFVKEKVLIICNC